MKKYNLNLFFALLIVHITNVLMAQNTPAGNINLNPPKKIRCSTVEYEAALRAKFPNRATTEEFEAWIAPKIERLKAERAAGRNIQTVYNIPVVIHIIHDGDNVGTGENITDAQAISQINVMNQDYRRMLNTPGGANTTGAAVDCEINFCLAKRDPAGNPTTGIVRHNITPYTNNIPDGSEGADWESMEDVEILKENTQWDPDNYLNMWTIRPGGLPLFLDGLSGLLGYAQFPSNSNLSGLTVNGGLAATDGVVAGYDVFGTIAEDDGSFMMNPTYNLGRTMTHEVGHWLGLRHIWGDGEDCDTNTDYCADTPVAIDANYECDIIDSCTSHPGNDMVENYMDYTNDACMDTFTQNQKDRMVIVMQNADRRGTLNNSIACSLPVNAGIYINPVAGKSTYNETTNCLATTVSYPISILKAPSTNATITFTVNSASTATEGADFEIVTPTITFNTGETSSKNLEIRYFNDGFVESNETIIIDLVLDANGGDAVMIADNNEIAVTIIDNDTTPELMVKNNLYLQNFETPSGWGQIDADQDDNGWSTINLFQGYGPIVGNCAYSVRDTTPLGGTDTYTPDNFLISPPITIPSDLSDFYLKYVIGGYCDNTFTATGGYKEHYSVYFTTDKSSVSSILSGTVLEPEREIPARNSQLRTHDLSSLAGPTIAGQTGYFVFRHFSSGFIANGMLLLDSIDLSKSFPTPAQTNISSTSQSLLNSNGVAYFNNASTSALISDVTSNTNFNYGCTTVAVIRDAAMAGAAAVNYGNNTANDLKVMAKVVSINPTTNNTSGNGNVKFYFSEAEITAWETITGKTRADLRVFKESTTGRTTTSQLEVLNTTAGTFGNNFTLTGTFTNGLKGDYYFGAEGTLKNASSNLDIDVSIYPNPVKKTLYIVMNKEYTGYKYTIYNTLGQMVKETTVTNIKDLVVNTENFSKGIYILKIEKEGKIKTIEFIKD